MTACRSAQSLTRSRLVLTSRPRRDSGCGTTVSTGLACPPDLGQVAPPLTLNRYGACRRRDAEDAAVAMCPATVAGWVNAMACEAGIAMVCALARRAMNCWPSGGIRRSAVATMYQLGAVFHAAAGDFSSNAAAVMGRCAAAAAAAEWWGRSAANTRW